MKLEQFRKSDTEEVIKLFTDVFADSEGESEGQIIGNLVSELIATTEPEDLIGFIAIDDDRIVASIFFSRLNVPKGQLAFILSPVAVCTSLQGTGIGQKIIKFGLDHLKSLQVNLAFTYGDPNYYSKVGFCHINETAVEAPQPLSQPQGWLAQSLNGDPIPSMEGKTICVAALDDPKYW
ncbi:N-acetyltransferase [Pseudomaricurvus alkylphenolicus]|uniref:GNAT family N-acetyltransferase n=1 Tax=Pseudomaricurvus alkylphenolicus TaxID=1306991 RepID=UPI00141E7C1D|nr:N-acetyltransferase [Pseudomaricurvus alkylphenolicus]NIB40934.1 N-acetyltransferase [Pseudomaricurvus alkylphenolicus]